MERFSLKRTGDEDYPNHIKGLLTGQPKSGKTTFLSTMPNVVIADVESAGGGLQSIAHLDIPYVTIDDRSKLDTLHTILKDDQLRAKAAKDLGLDVIESVSIDTLDSLQELLKKERLKSERRQQMQRDDWGWLLEELTEIVRAFTSLPLNVMFTVHAKQIQDDEARVIWVPGLQGAIQDKIAGEVGYSLFTIREVEIDAQTGKKHNVYSILTEGDDYHPHLGNRAAGRLPRIIDPNFAALHKAVYDGLQLAKTKRVEQDEPVQSDDTEQAPAQTSGQPEQTSVAAAEQQQADGAPRDDSNDPVNEAALSHLRKIVKEFGAELNPDATSWTLGYAREVARYVVACKQDVAEGNTPQENLYEVVMEGLKGMNAVSYCDEDGAVVPDGSVDDVVKWATTGARAEAALAHEEAKGDDGRKTLKSKLESAIKSPASEADPQEPTTEPTPEPTPEPEANGQASEQDSESAEEQTPEPPTAEEAAQRIKDELGGAEVSSNDADHQPEADPEEVKPCEVCGKTKQANPDEFDLDIARLSEVRFKQWLCVQDYMSRVQQGKTAANA